MFKVLRGHQRKNSLRSGISEHAVTFFFINEFIYFWLCWVFVAGFL